MTELQISPYDRGWVAAFAAERSRIARRSASRAADRPPPSTSGLDAKPIIDLISVVNPAAPHMPSLATLGYVHLRTPTMPSARSFSARPMAALAPCPVAIRRGSDERRTLAFRDFLREHPVARDYRAQETAGGDRPRRRPLSREACAGQERIIDRVVQMALAARVIRTGCEGTVPGHGPESSRSVLGPSSVVTVARTPRPKNQKESA